MHWEKFKNLDESEKFVVNRKDAFPRKFTTEKNRFGTKNRT